MASSLAIRRPNLAGRSERGVVMPDNGCPAGPGEESTDWLQQFLAAARCRDLDQLRTKLLVQSLDAAEWQAERAKIDAAKGQGPYDQDDDTSA